jgi:hypothetical protein
MISFRQVSLLLFIPFLLGNSAGGGLGAVMAVYAVAAIAGLGVIVGSIWAIYKFFTQ